MRRSKLLYLAWVLAIVLLVAIVTTYKGRSTTFYGIAETRETIVNSENAVEIKKVHVVPGQAVGEGELLVELARPDLTMDINAISHQIDELKAQDSADIHELKTRANALRAQKAARISDINYRIKQLEAQYEINRELTSDLKSLGQTGKDRAQAPGRSPIEIEIENLKAALALSVEPMQIEIDMIEKSLATGENPLKIQAESLEEELSLLLDEKNKLFIFAQVSGVIGSVNVRERERVVPFSPILTLHTRTPSYVRGFIHEKAYSRISVGQRTRIASLADPGNRIIGNVIGVGSRIIEYPRRLKEMLAIPVWGREVLIKIHEDNRFLLGEKVLISLCDNCEQEASITGSLLTRGLSAGNTYATGIENDQKEPRISSVPADIRIDRSLRNVSPVEASGVTYLEDLRKYLLISDDTRGNRPVLYLMSSEGNIEDELVIRGIGEIIDMEAIAQDDVGRIYVLSSQSFDKGNRLPAARKQLLRLNRDRALLTLDARISLYDLLKSAAGRHPSGPMSVVAPAGPESLSLDVEGLFFNAGDMYLGLKEPLSEQRAVILRIAGIDDVFDRNSLDEGDVQIWKSLDLRDRESGRPAGISDLHFHDGKLLVLSYAPPEAGSPGRGDGNLWAYDLQEDSLSHMRRLEDLKPEGITFNPTRNAYLVTFDHGRDQPSQFLELEGLSD